MRWLPILLLLGCLPAQPDRYHVSYGHGDGEIQGHEGYDTDEQYVEVGVSGPLIPLRRSSRLERPQDQVPYEQAPEEAAQADEAAEEPGPWWKEGTFLAWIERVLLLALGAAGLHGGKKGYEKLRKA